MTPDPRISDFLAELGNRFRPEQVESFWDCEPTFSALLGSDAVRGFLNQRLAEMESDPDGYWTGNQSETVIHVGGGTALLVSHLAPRRYLHVLPYHALYGVLGDGEVSYNRFEAPPGYRADVFDPSLRLSAADSGVLAGGQHLRLAAGACAVDFAAERPILLLKLVTTAILPLEWLFKKDTLQAWQANDADLSFTQLRVAADVLGKLAHQSSIEPLKLMTSHGHHAVRWAAITNLGRINRTEALAKLKQAVDDPHPHVRNAALKTLRKVQPQ